VAKEFRNKIRCYNNIFAFTSLGVNEQTLGLRGSGVYSFRIKGALYHRIGSLLPIAGQIPKFAQIYTHDSSNYTTQVGNRLQVFDNLDALIVSQIQHYLSEINPYVQLFHTAGDLITSNAAIIRTLRLRIQDPREQGKDPRTYNTPTANEIGVLIEGMGEENLEPREIILHYKGPEHQAEPLKRISELHASYLPLRYPLIMMRGEQGWHPDIPLTGNVVAGNAARNEYTRVEDPLPDIETRVAFQEVNPTTGRGGSKRVTLTLFHAYHLHIRSPTPSHLFLAGRLFQEWCVDAFAATEQNNLRWVFSNQKTLRSDQYQGLADTLANQGDMDMASLGKRVILPSTFAGSPRQMTELYQDAMAIVRAFGKPDFFITMTCNPAWPEIKENLLNGQQATDRPDLVARVFQLKLSSLMKDLIEKGVLGKVKAHIYVIEFQKRGLPHAHILMMLNTADVIHSVEQIDHAVSAEIPNQEADPQLWETVTTCMLHGPCGVENRNAPCMVDGRGLDGCCSKRYPKGFLEETILGEDSYPHYRRRQDGRYIDKTRVQQDGTTATFRYDNRWVIPYNPFLTKRYNCHINVEICSSIQAVKYLYKYVYKGPDRANLLLEDPLNIDEVKVYLDTRYISAPEATWRLLGNKMHDGSPPIQRLQLHLPQQQPVYFSAEDHLQGIVNQAESRDTTLTAYFKANSKYPYAQNIFYQDFPTYFVFQRKEREWTPRKQGISIGRMYFCGPKSGERFFERLLLLHTKGATSFNSLKTVNGIQYSTFREACNAKGLLASDDEWKAVLEDGSSMLTGFQQRLLFAVILTECNSAEPKDLWERFKMSLTDDCIHQLIHKYGIHDPTIDERLSLGLSLIQEIIQQSGKSLEDFGIPKPVYEFQLNNITEYSNRHEENSERTENLPVLRMEAERDLQKCNHLQRHAIDTILEHICLSNTALFFLDGPGGTGKTFVENLLLNTIRSQGNIAIAVASSGIAATLLHSGQTAHSTFKIPISIDKDSYCNIPKNSHLAVRIQKAKILIWDEAPMQHRHAFEAVDRTLRDIRNTPLQAFGGLTVLFAGDFRQCLPIVPRGSRGQIVASCLKRSYLWPSVITLHLQENYRLLGSYMSSQQRKDATEYAEFILAIGEKRFEEYAVEKIQLPRALQLPNNKVEELIDCVYRSLKEILPTPQYLAERAILAPRNIDVANINDIVLELLPGESTIYFSADTVTEGAAELYSSEYLNSLTLSGMPYHRLSLKIGATVILLRNLSPLNGLCNGTRLQITHLGRNLIGGIILTGTCKGQKAYLPRIEITSNPDSDLGFQLKRRQYPVRLAFAMTINKSQGQSLKVVGVCLEDDVFTHGQLYVALSRASDPHNVKVLTRNDVDLGVTKNIVFSEVL